MSFKNIAKFVRGIDKPIDDIVMDLKKKKRVVTFKEVQKELKKKNVKVSKDFLKNYLKDNFSIYSKTAETLPGWDNDDLDFVRRAIAAETDAINLYLNQAEETKDSRVKELLLHIAKDEKEHLAELNYLLSELDDEQFEVEDMVYEKGLDHE